jgi:hypothetical protein
VVLKDNDEYELASDDDVQDVIADGKLRLYRIADASTQVVPVPLPTSSSLPSQQSVLSPPLVSAPSQSSSNLVSKDTILNLANLKLPVIGPEVKHRLRAYCPQIRKGLIEIPLPSTLTSYL